jgi:hypothetical protein
MGGESLDMADLSPVVANAETFEVCRCYVIGDYEKARSMIKNIIGTLTTENDDANP